MNESRFERIERYLRSELSREEELLFEQEMAADPQLQQEAREVQELILVVKESGRARLIHDLESDVPTGSANFQPLLRIAAVVALVALGGYGVFTWFAYQRAEDIVGSYYEPLNDLELQAVPGNPQLTQTKEKALAEYRDGRFENSLAMLPSSSAHPTDADIHMLRGLNHLGLKEFKPATAEFRSVRTMKARHLTEGTWYLSLCLIATRHNDEALRLLGELSRSNDKLYKARAARLVADLSE